MKTKLFSMYITTLLLAVSIVYAESEKQTANDLSFTVSSLPEAQLGFTHAVTFPFLRGGSFLTAGNNARLSIGGTLTPISVNANAEAEITPIAFLKFNAGAKIGTGWTINLYEADLVGMAINAEGEDRDWEKRNADGSGFDGAVWRANLGTTIQFDAAALWPGDWHHIVLQSYHEAHYRAYTRALSGKYWIYEADEGFNQNAFYYYTGNVIGYQMPFFLNMAAFMAETEFALYNPDSRTDLRGGKYADSITLSGILNFEISKKMGLATLVQWSKHGAEHDLQFLRVVGILSWHL
jgi:hypothetical protein